MSSSQAQPSIDATAAPIHQETDAALCRCGSAPYVVCLTPTEDRSALLVDIYESDDAFTIEGSAPGAHPQDIQITMEGTRVTIHVRPESGQTLRPGRAVRRERYAGGWRRSIVLPMTVTPAALTWALRDGVLSLRIAKTAPISATEAAQDTAGAAM